MYVVQRRDSENCQWKTCSYKNKKCRYEYIADARIAFRNLKNMPEHTKIPTRMFRIWDSEINEEVK